MKTQNMIVFALEFTNNSFSGRRSEIVRDPLQPSLSPQPLFRRRSGP
jgi:hypothetical protein